MIFRQIIHDDLGCASYLIGDEKAGVAGVVDPRFEIDEYLELARYMGVASSTSSRPTPRRPRLRPRSPGRGDRGDAFTSTGTRSPSTSHEPFDDGEELELGALRVRALHTPGHRPEHTAFALIDTRAQRRSRGRCSRATRCSSATSHAPIWRSRSRRARAASSTRCTRSCSSCRTTCEVWPGHLGGSMCGGPGMDMKVSSTIGYERDNNPVLVDRRRGRVRHARPWRSSARSRRTSGTIVELNQGPLRTEGIELLPLEPRQVEDRRAAGALLVDVRTDLQFDEAHIPGAVSNPDDARRLRDQARLARRPRRGDRVRRPRRRGRPTRRRACRCGRASQRRRLPAERDDELAAGGRGR